MKNQYETGTRVQVIEELLRCAIQDRDALIDSVSPLSENDSERIEVTAQCEATIREFKKLKKEIKELFKSKGKEQL